MGSAEGVVCAIVSFVSHSEFSQKWINVSKWECNAQSLAREFERFWSHGVCWESDERYDTFPQKNSTNMKIQYFVCNSGSKDLEIIL